MLTVAKISYRRGYSGEDHLLDDDELTPLIGRTFRSLRDVERAADKLSTGTRGRPHSYYWVAYVIGGHMMEGEI